MKICYAAIDVSVPHYRGASTHVYEVAKHLVELGHEVHVVSRRISPSQAEYVNLDGIHIHRIYRGIAAPLPSSSYQKLEKEEKALSVMDRFYEAYLFSLYPLFAGLFTSSIVKRYNVEILIERETSFGAGAIASVITSRPMILEIIGPRYSKLSVKRADRILAYTKSMIHGYVPIEKVDFVEAAADVQLFKPDSDSGLRIRDRLNLKDSVVVGYVGTFAVWHGLEELVEAGSRVLKRFPEIRFLMVGPYFKFVKQLVHKHSLVDFFIFTGPVPYAKIPEYINACDILVAPYNPLKSEERRKYGIGSPLKVFEYMACGKPAITTAVEPITRVIRDGDTGILVPPGDSSALCEAITLLIKRRKLREKVGKNARREVERNYSWESFSRNLEEILEEALDSKNYGE